MRCPATYLYYNDKLLMIHIISNIILLVIIKVAPCASATLSQRSYRVEATEQTHVPRALPRDLSTLLYN